MADSVVSCPSCGKKYRVREDSASRTFICNACGGEVSAGPAPAKARPARARPAQGRPSGGGGGRPRRAKAAAGAPTGGLKRTRAASDRAGRLQREGAPPPKTNTMLYVGLGGLIVVVMAVIVVIVMNTDDTPVKPGPNVVDANGDLPPDDAPPTGGNTDAPPSKGTRPEALREDPEDDIVLPEPMEAPDELVEEKPEQIEKVSRTIDENETDPYKMSKVTLRSKAYSWYVKNDHFKHLDDTPADLRQEIDDLCAKMVDFDLGSMANEAADRLVEIGKPAVPRVLLAFSKAGDLGDRIGMINACVIDDALWRICGGHAKTDQMKQFQGPSKSVILKTAKYWCAWWFSAGHKMDAFIDDEPEEEEE